ncbi:MAG: flagellar hook-basal body complex protein FliE [Gammaproteobacteria bacterium]
MSTNNIDQVLSQMRVLAQNHKIPGAPESNGNEFATLLKDSINQVNQLQQEATQLKTSFEQGDPQVDITEVMIAVEKASLSFDAITEVRNKLLTAYQEVMNMQV